jgi:hypothetical protein
MTPFFDIANYEVRHQGSVTQFGLDSKRADSGAFVVSAKVPPAYIIVPPPQAFAFKLAGAGT